VVGGGRSGRGRADLVADGGGSGWGVVGGGAGEGVGGRANGSISNIQDGALLLPLRTK